MITFACHNCGRTIQVPDAAAGRQGTCKTCHTSLLVPNPPAPIIIPPPQEIFIPATGFPRPASQSVRVTVHNNQKGAAAHSLGLAAMVLGVIGLAVCWIPIVGLLAAPLTFVGLVMGLIGFLIALFRNGHGIGFPIAAIAISGTALAIAATLNYAILEPILTPAIKQAREAAERAKAKQNQQ